MPLPVVITEGGIPRAAKRVAAPVVSDSHVASTIIGGVLCPIDREVSIPINGEVSVTIHRYVIARTKLVRVAITIDVSVSVPIHREISFAIDR